METVGAAIARCARVLGRAGVHFGHGTDNARDEAAELVFFAAGIAHKAGARAYLRPLSLRHRRRVDELLQRRMTERVPLAYLTRRAFFAGLELYVDERVLVPRSPIAGLVQRRFHPWIGARRVRRILDLGTGTGALLLAALTEFPAAFGLGVDRPEPAALAARNAARLGLSDRAAFAAADWAAPVQGAFDLILANPPYVETAAIPGLMPEVAHFEPASALDGGADGLDAYRRIIPELPRLLAPRGAAILELGVGQAGPVSRLAASFGLAGAVRDDLGGISRALVLRSGG